MIKATFERDEYDESLESQTPLYTLLTFANPTVAQAALFVVVTLDSTARVVGRFVSAALDTYDLAMVEHLCDVERVWRNATVSPLLDSIDPVIGLSHTRRIDSHLTGAGVRVGVLDTSVDETHPDLVGQVLHGGPLPFSEIRDTDDVIGHGTAVAAIIAGTGAASNGRFVGIAPEATIISHKVIGDDGHGNMSEILMALEFSYAANMHVVNMSIGSEIEYEYHYPLAEMIRSHVGGGVIFVAGAGNSGPVRQSSYPSNDPNVISVGNVQDDFTMNITSSRGDENDEYLTPDFVAPGTDITTALSSLSPYTPTDGFPLYTTQTGTSLSAPVVSGICALLKQDNPNITIDEVRAKLALSVRHLVGTPGYTQGRGCVHLFRALHSKAASSSRDETMLHLSPGLQKHMLENFGVSRVLEYGVIDVYSGEPPIGAHLPPTGTHLARITRNGHPHTFGSTTNGLTFNKNKAGVLRDTGDWIMTVLAEGTAGWWRFSSYDGNEGVSYVLPRIDGTVGDSMFLYTTTLHPDISPVFIERFYLTFSEG